MGIVRVPTTEILTIDRIFYSSNLVVVEGWGGGGGGDDVCFTALFDNESH